MCECVIDYKGLTIQVNAKSHTYRVKHYVYWECRSWVKVHQWYSNGENGK